MAERQVAVGCYTPESGGSGSGITLYSWDDRSGELTIRDSAAMVSPSWLQWHPRLPVLYAANEIEAGTVSVLSVGAGLKVEATVGIGGSLPCHLAVAEDGSRLFAANYGSGSLSMFDLDPTGAIRGLAGLVSHAGSGPDPDRQEAPHVHMIALAGGLISAVDLGTDEIRSYRVTDTGLAAARVSTLPPGTGPRQLVRNPHTGRSYLVAELAGALLTVVEPAPGSFEVIDSVAGSEQPIRNLPAQFSLSADGRFGYLSNRYPNSLTVFSLAQPRPVRVAEFAAGDGWPRHFAIAGDWLLAANQHSNELLVFAIEDGGARLREVRRYPVASPTCVAIR
ncbi:MAG: lactonase family protein [Actinomycetota bacterium]|nr:lactonase family protein [Actinomycetota bacterium]